MREPLLGVITAITPFNHPLNQVIHKVAPAVATNNRVVLKPSEKTPLTAFALADILYEAGLPPEMLSVVTGDPAEIADELLTSAERRSRDLHRRRVDRQVHCRQGRLQAAGSGTRRQRSDHRARRCGPRGSSHAGGERFLQELRPAMHCRQAHAGSGKRRRSLRRTAGRKNARRQVRRSVRSRDGHGHGDRRAGRAAIRGGRERGGGGGRPTAGRQCASRSALLADRTRPGHARA